MYVDKARREWVARVLKVNKINVVSARACVCVWRLIFLSERNARSGFIQKIWPVYLCICKSHCVCLGPLMQLSVPERLQCVITLAIKHDKRAFLLQCPAAGCQLQRKHQFTSDVFTNWESQHMLSSAFVPSDTLSTFDLRQTSKQLCLSKISFFRSIIMFFSLIINLYRLYLLMSFSSSAFFLFIIFKILSESEEAWWVSGFVCLL